MRASVLCLLLGTFGCSAQAKSPTTSVDQERPPSDCHTCPPAGQCPYEALLDECGCLVRCKSAPKFDPVFQQGFHACATDPAFLFAYTLRVEADANDARLQKAIWRDKPKNQVPVSPNDPNISDAMCYASGPHRGLNLSNWCCRE